MVPSLVNLVGGVVLMAAGIFDHWVNVTTDSSAELYTILNASRTESGEDLASDLASLIVYFSEVVTYVFQGLSSVTDFLD
jgi:hypothetical protein